MLTATHLACSRGERRLFSDLDLTVEPGRWLHVAGENGCGKTTLLRTLMGLCAADEGEIRWHGVPASECREAFHRALVFLGHHVALKGELSPLENLRFSAAIDGIAVADDQAQTALARLGLRGREELPARYLSAGQKRRVLLARLLVRPATLWVLDEPFTALDGAGVELVAGLIQAHLAQGGMAILTSHQSVPLSDGKVVSL
jgi:heme exporter protein A